MWWRQMEDAGGAERLQVETANPWLSCAQHAREGPPSRRHALVSNLRHTKDPLAWRGSLTEGSLTEQNLGDKSRRSVWQVGGWGVVGGIAWGTNLVEGAPRRRSLPSLIAPMPANAGASVLLAALGRWRWRDFLRDGWPCCARPHAPPGRAAGGRAPSDAALLAPIASPRSGRPGARPGRAAHPVRK